MPRAWGDVDREITALAPAVPLVWDKVPMAHSADVNAVANENLGVWDFSFTSLALVRNFFATTLREARGASGPADMVAGPVSLAWLKNNCRHPQTSFDLGEADGRGSA